MINVIIEERLYDKEFVDKWCTGFDQVESLVKEYPPAVVETVTSIPAEKVIQAARIYAINKPSIMQAMWSVTHSQLGRGRTLSVNLAKCILRALTGNLDIDGGDLLRGDIPMAYDRNMYWDRLIDHPERKRDTIGHHRFPIMSVGAFKLYRDIWQRYFSVSGYPLAMAVAPNTSPYFLWNGVLEGKPYPIRAMIIEGMNVLCTRTNTPDIHRALRSENLELQVTMDVFMTPHGMLADYVLPAADWMERPLLDPGAYTGFACEQAVQPKYERRNDYDLWRGLGIRLGQDVFWPPTIEEMYSKFLEPTSLSFAEFVRKTRWEKDSRSSAGRQYKVYEQKGFATASGKVELAPGILKKLGCEILPKFDDLLSRLRYSAPYGNKYPLVLITGGRLRTFFHSSLRELPKLRSRHPDPITQIHPETAKMFGITDGDWVYIETPSGRIKQKAEVTSKIHPDVVHAEHGWWFPEQIAEEPSLFGLWQSNIEVVLSNEPEICDFQGAPPMRALPCRISRE